MSAPVDPLVAAFAAEVGDTGPVAVEGGRTRWDTGGALLPETRVLRAPDGIIAYQPDEMTVRVRAGTSVEVLHGELASAGQRTALPERGGTVGGALMVGENGPFVLGRGPLRNSVLQVGYVSAEGRVISGGGATVKNVSGFDIPRLLTGSLGTLGLLGETILRTNPIPPVSRWLSSTDADPFDAFDVLLRPGGVFYDGTTTTVLLEGHGVDVDAEREVLGRIGTFGPASGLPELPPHRWSLAPSDLRTIDASATGAYVALVGVGTVYAQQAQAPRSADSASRQVTARMKERFDPTGRLNPGRDVCGAAPARSV
jgi:glycolate oxidase FAD binding subunit